MNYTVIKRNDTWEVLHYRGEVYQRTFDSKIMGKGPMYTTPPFPSSAFCLFVAPCQSIDSKHLSSIVNHLSSKYECQKSTLIKFVLLIYLY